MAGFTFAYRESGGAPTVQSFLSKNTETLTRGDIANLETGEIDLAAAGDANLVGVICETKAGVDSTTLQEVITDVDAVYSVVDANARVVGAPLDITGATGAQGVTTASGKEFVVVAASSASEPTLVKFNIAKHFRNKAQ